MEAVMVLPTLMCKLLIYRKELLLANRANSTSIGFYYRTHIFPLSMILKTINDII